MSTAIQCIDVEVDVQTAYDQWTQFESFPQFMSHVTTVTQWDPTTARFTVDIAGRTYTYDAEITEQIPGKRIAWCARQGPETSGVVTFHYLSPTTTRVVLQLGYAPTGVLESLADLVNVVDLVARRDLAAFKRFIEARGDATGAWGGTVSRGEVTTTERDAQPGA